MHFRQLTRQMIEANERLHPGQRIAAFDSLAAISRDSHPTWDGLQEILDPGMHAYNILLIAARLFSHLLTVQLVCVIINFAQ